VQNVGWNEDHKDGGAAVDGREPGKSQVLEQLALSAGHAGAPAEAFERRQTDGRQQADDRHHHQQLDQSESGRRLGTRDRACTFHSMVEPAVHGLNHQLRMLSLLNPLVAGPESILPSGPNDQTMIGRLASNESPPAERTRPFQPLSVPTCMSETGACLYQASRHLLSAFRSRLMMYGLPHGSR